MQLHSVKKTAKPRHNSRTNHKKIIKNVNKPLLTRPFCATIRPHQRTITTSKSPKIKTQQGGVNLTNIGYYQQGSKSPSLSFSIPHQFFSTNLSHIPTTTSIHSPNKFHPTTPSFTFTTQHSFSTKTSPTTTTISNPQSKHYLIIGLGNKGDEYNNTRHNIGKDYVLKLSKLFKSPLDQETSDCIHSKPIDINAVLDIIDIDVILSNNLPKKKPEQQQQPRQINKSQSDQSINQTNAINSTPNSTNIANVNGNENVSTQNHTTTTTTTTDTATTTTTNNTNNNDSSPTTDTTIKSPISSSNSKNKQQQKQKPQFIPVESIPSQTLITLAFPKSYMNVSGRPIHRLIQSLRIPVQNVIVLHDDLEVKSGQIKAKNSGSHGGQNGLRDLLDVLGHNAQFNRVRLGIGRPLNGSSDVAGYVLGKFTPNERENLKFADKYLFSIISQIICYGSELASQHGQNFYNAYQLILNPPLPKPQVNKPKQTTTTTTTATTTIPPKKSKVDTTALFGI